MKFGVYVQWETIYLVYMQPGKQFIEVIGTISGISK